MARIYRHPVVDIPDGEYIEIILDRKTLRAKKGEMIAAALLANGIDVFRRTKRFHQPRSIFCGIGQCNDCVMIVDGVPNVRTCVTPVRDGMVITTQEGLGRMGASDES